jgi:GNAT superfamily N-acetyltransferase
VTDWDDRLAALWASLDQVSDEPGADGFVATMAALVAELPTGSPVGAFERAAAFDSTGHSDRAVPLYREALAGDLDPERRRRAVIQLASSLRNLGRADESIALLTTERAAGSDHLDDAVDAFLALALADTGREREALSYALAALAAHLPRYQRSVRDYARSLTGPAEPTPPTVDEPFLIRRPTGVAEVIAAESLFDEPARSEWAHRFLTEPGHHIFIAYVDGAPAGMVTGVETTHPDKGTEMFLYELGVDEPYQRRGIGRALVRVLADTARERGCYGMWVLTERSNTAAMATYRSAGGSDDGDQVMLSWSFPHGPAAAGAPDAAGRP